MLISLQQCEINELAVPYRLDPSSSIQPNEEIRQFASTGRYYRCVSDGAYGIVIKHIQESASSSTGTPLWL